MWCSWEVTTELRKAASVRSAKRVLANRVVSQFLDTHPDVCRMAKAAQATCALCTAWTGRPLSVSAVLVGATNVARDCPGRPGDRPAYSGRRSSRFPRCCTAPNSRRLRRCCARWVPPRDPHARRRTLRGGRPCGTRRLGADALHERSRPRPVRCSRPRSAARDHVPRPIAPPDPRARGRSPEYASTRPGNPTASARRSPSAAPGRRAAPPAPRG
jgi:hypothetical protein